ncbi:MAG: class I SAM-dependent rRNA methyltransferase, partial [Clostridia bacterium]|nr:class I SAM-dependent rRNA methyltransferase [Clostridia bacterium]
GRRVLDCFTHTGSFGLNAAAGGALEVTSIDISADALAMAQKNADRNRLSDRISYVQADVFDYLRALEAAGRRAHSYDFIILDPPAFTKSRDTLRNAIKGYREINAAAMRLLPRGGYLATCSCSHFMTDSYFKQMIHNAAEDAGVSLRQIEARKQGPDHPVLWNVPETDYLSFYIFQIV